jgi:hypothetical protein
MRNLGILPPMTSEVSEFESIREKGKGKCRKWSWNFDHLPIFTAISDGNDESPCKLLIRLWQIFSICSRVLERIRKGTKWKRIKIQGKRKGRREGIAIRVKLPF